MTAVATVKTWIGSHNRRNCVQLEFNMQASDPAYIWRLIYIRDRGATKGKFVRRQLRTHTSIGITGWDGSVYAELMGEFAVEHKADIRALAVALIASNTDEVHRLTLSLESALVALKARLLETA